MAALGPLVEAIRADVAITFTQIALLTTLPVLAMGLGCFVNAVLVRRLGMSGVIALALAAIALADALHWLGLGKAGLMISALGAGIGIAFIQATLPGIIKHAAGVKTPLVMGLYIAAIMGGAALASFLTPALSHWIGWEGSLALWSVPAVVALAVWLGRRALMPAPPERSSARLSLRQVARVPRFWALATFFGLGTAGYTCVLAWVPPTFTSLGWPPTQAGLALSWLTVLEVIAGLLFPALAQRMGDRRPVLFTVLGLAVAGFLLLGLMPQATGWLATALIGLGIGGLFPMSLIITMDHLDDPAAAGQLTAWVQGIGYVIASLSPLVAGVMKDALGGFQPAWLVLGGVFLGLMGLALRFDNDRVARRAHSLGAAVAA
nr:MFS transporter [Larsenimonas rhizosphaerae]